MLDAKLGYDFGGTCILPRGPEIETWLTGDKDHNAISIYYSCGGVYHNNYLSTEQHETNECFWDCSRCRHKKHV